MFSTGMKLKFGLLFCFILPIFFFQSNLVYGGTYFINITDADFYSVWTNGTNILDNQFLDNSTFYNGTYRALIYSSDPENTPTGSDQTDDVLFFVQGADFNSFWMHKESSSYTFRYNTSLFITGNADQDGLFTGLYLTDAYAILGPYGELISMTTVRLGFFLGGFTLLLAPLAYIAGKRPNGGVVIKCAMVMFFGFALLLAMVDLT